MTEEAKNNNQYLAFTLDREVFALNITVVREVLELTRITRVPRTPEFMRGVINLRGHAVPVADLRMKFGMGRVEDTVDTCIIIADIRCEDESAVVGMRVDSVREVFEMPPDAIEAAPRLGNSIDTDFIMGMGRQNDAFVVILDIGRIFTAQELSNLKSVGEGGERAA